MNAGLTGKQWKDAEELFAKANKEQLKQMILLIDAKLSRTESIVWVNSENRYE